MPVTSLAGYVSINVKEAFESIAVVSAATVRGPGGTITSHVSVNPCRTRTVTCAV